MSKRMMCARTIEKHLYIGRFITFQRHRHAATLSPSASHCRTPSPKRIGYLCQWQRRSSSTALPGGSSAHSSPNREDFRKTFLLPRATHALESLSNKDVGQFVVLHGYLGSRRDMSKTLSFSSLSASTSLRTIQIISNARNEQNQRTGAHDLIRSTPRHSAVTVSGTVRYKHQQAGRQSSMTAAGSHVRHEEDIELELNEFGLLNAFPTSIKFGDDTVIPPEQRHLQLRQDTEIQKALQFRSQLSKVCREYLQDQQGFTEVETPLLFKSTPEGAREFLVPTRRWGYTYALPQSPQQYKQILMGSGISRYYQIARCFRDEDLRADRQPEFTQLDLEMSFANSQDVMASTEGLIRQLWKALLEQELPDAPFRVLPYQDAMDRYGSDKPDDRLGMEIMKIGHMIPADLVSKIGPLADPIVEVFKLSLSSDPRETSDFIKSFMDSQEAVPFLSNPDGQPGVFVFDPRKPLGGLQPFGFEAAEQIEESLGLEEGDVVVLQARKNVSHFGGSTSLGRLRLVLHKAAVARGHVENPEGWSFCWINQFPLFSPNDPSEPGQGGDAGIYSTHHPFTAPASLEDLDLLATEPLRVRADHYDLVLNGIELGGGSRRIHNAGLQRYILSDVLKINEKRMEDFAHLLTVLSHGCPPHAGIALGFDRLCAVMLGKESIRDVIAFPKSGSGEDLLVKSPTKATKEQLKTYHLELKS